MQSEVSVIVVLGLLTICSQTLMAAIDNLLNRLSVFDLIQLRCHELLVPG